MWDLSTKHSTWEPLFELLIFQYGGKDGGQLPKMLKMAGMPGLLGKQCSQYNCIYLIWISVQVVVKYSKSLPKLPYNNKVCVVRQRQGMGRRKLV